MTQRPTKVQSVILSIMRERRPGIDPNIDPGYPAAIDHGEMRNFIFSSMHGECEGQWVWMHHRTAAAMLWHGWIEWQDRAGLKRAGYYVTAAGREVLLT